MFSKDLSSVKFENLEQTWQITLKKLPLVEEEKLSEVVRQYPAFMANPTSAKNKGISSLIHGEK